MGFETEGAPILFKAGAPFPASADADYEFRSILLQRAGDTAEFGRKSNDGLALA
ncbi:MAG: hypothetical protein JF628_08660 [Sphingomonas sp.]|nr:hypothetical protein [Sphingomonas sp.]